MIKNTLRRNHMDKNKKIMIGAIGAAVVAGGVAIGLIVSRTPPKADLSTFHTEASTKAPTETEVKPQTTVSETETTAKTEKNASRLSAVTATYTSGKVSIQYPVIEDMEDTQKQEQINEHLKANALSVLKGYEINEETDSLTVSCEIVSADRKRLYCRLCRQPDEKRRSSNKHFLYEHGEPGPDTGHGIKRFYRCLYHGRLCAQRRCSVPAAEC